MREELTQERLKELLHYDPETGNFIWKVFSGPRALKGQVAGSVEGQGYIGIQIDGVTYKAHRLAFLIVEGRIPEFVDHIDRDRRNNKWYNLRPCSKSENIANSTISRANTSGYKGVGKCSGSEMYRARIKCGGKTYYLGRFSCPREAAHAYNVAAIQLHGEFAVLNPI